MIQLQAVDIAIILGALLLVAGVASYNTYLANSHSSEETTVSEYFLAHRNVPWWAVAGSLFASNIGNEHFVGQAGTAAHSGLAVALYEWLASYLLFLLGYVFAPVYMKNKVTTIPEWFEVRFSKEARGVLAVMCLFGAVVTKISASLFSGALLCEVVLGIDFWTSIPFILVFCGGYTMIGGLTTVVYTDVVQALIFTTGGIVGAIVSLNAVGGWSSMKETFALKEYTSDFPHVIRGTSSEFAWTGMFFGQMLGSIWYWCIDQEMAQRVIAARTVRHAKGGTTFAGFLKILPPFIIAFPGMAARVMYERCSNSNGAEFSSWCSSTNPEINLDGPAADKAYLFLITRLFPTGVVGLILVSMIVSMMSALASVFNSASTVFTVDIYQRFYKPKACNKELLFVGRSFTLVMVGFSFLWLLAIKSQTNGIYLITQNIQTHIAPPLAVVAIMGIFWPRINAQGAIWGIVSGVVVGLGQYIPSLIYEDQCKNQNSFGLVFACMHFNHYASLVGIFVFIVTAGVSYAYPEPENWKLKGIVQDDMNTCEMDALNDSQNDVKAHEEPKTEMDMVVGDQKSSNTKDLLLNLTTAVMLLSVTVVIVLFR
ncbi:hypothetical protein HDV02_006060 [Globomyces sp. JEL0801]|nr:hypothetical protein HDV02_006060 [Globomyces sp. JEL0801]